MKKNAKDSKNTQMYIYSENRCAKNEINLFNNHVLIVAPVTFAPAGATTPSTEFLFLLVWLGVSLRNSACMDQF